MNPQFYILSLILLFASTTSLSVAQEKYLKTPSYTLDLEEIYNTSKTDLIEKHEKSKTTKDKTITWLGVITKSLQDDVPSIYFQEAEEFLSWVFTQTESTNIVMGTTALSSRFRNASAYDGLVLIDKYLSQYSSNITSRDRFLISYLLAYDFAFFLQFEKQNSLYLANLDTMNNFQPKNLSETIWLGSALNGFGQSLLKRNRPTEALKYLLKAEELFKSTSGAEGTLYVLEYNIAGVFIKIKDYDRAEFYIRKSIVNFPLDRKDGRIAIQARLAEAKSGLNDLKSALLILKKAELTIQNPRDDYSLIFLETYMDILAKSENFSLALEKGSDALLLAKKLQNTEIQSRLNYKIGLLHAKLNNFNDAETLIITAINTLLNLKGYNDADAFATLVEFYTMVGREEDAFKAKRTQIEAEEYLRKIINKDILADLKSVSELREAQKIENQKPSKKEISKSDRLQSDDNILSFLFLFFIILITFVIIRVFVIFKNSSKV